MLTPQAEKFFGQILILIEEDGKLEALAQADSSQQLAMLAEYGRKAIDRQYATFAGLKAKPQAWDFMAEALSRRTHRDAAVQAANRGLAQMGLLPN
ncbi:MAG: hypothetical protein Q4A62_10855 [Eikenella sp.]|nr:hypothetical protein [Eikenella sp.]